jgi:hypothetical protein
MTETVMQKLIIGGGGDEAEVGGGWLAKTV